jgi:homoserine/homoserine lactone efflux protein
MTLSLTLGMSIGFKKTLHFMWGELIGVGLVAVLSVVGVAAILLRWPTVFTVFKTIGGCYLIYLGVQMWLSRGKMSLQQQSEADYQVSPLTLAGQGFVTAVSNPKGWAFFVSLLPPFIDASLPFAPQVAMLVVVILIIEFLSLILYAGGGKTLRKLLNDSSNVRLVNRIAGTLMIGVAFWLILG